MPNISKIVRSSRNKPDQIKVALQIYAILNEAELSDMQLSVMAYFCIYGINERTKDFLKNDLKLVSSDASYKKVLWTLKKEGFLDYDKKEGRGYIISSKIKLDIRQDITFLIQISHPNIKLDEEQ
jgi:hypothetical protein